MSEGVCHEAACAVAEWWASKIDGRHHHENGDHSFSGILAMAIADSAMQPTDTEQIENFKNALVRRLESGEFTFNGNTSMYCDYGPGTILRESAREAGISENNFPFKTSAFIKDGVVTVKDGYYGLPYTIYPEMKKEE